MKNRPEPHDTLGWAYYQQGNASRALMSFERALSLEPGNPTYHYHRGLAYLKIGDTSRGRAALTRARELKPDATTADETRRALAEMMADR